MTKLSAELIGSIVSHAVLVDLRPSESYQQGHLANATCLPVDELEERIHELPTKHVPINLIGSRKDLDSAGEILAKKNYQIDHSYIAEDLFWGLLAELNLLEPGNESRRLWQPNPLLEEYIDIIEQRVDGRYGLDIACGSGRDMTYLATRGWQMSGVDYINKSLSKAKALARRNGIDIEVNQCDVEKSPEVINEFRVDLIMVMRYLHRPLFERIKQALKPGGIIVYQTFLEAAKFYGKPKNPNFLLREGELKEEFEGFDIIVDREDRLPDDRPLASFIAQKPR